IIIIAAIVFLLTGFRENIYVQHALSCVSVCVLALIIDAVISMWKKGVKDWLGVVICLATFAVTVFTDVSPVIAVIAAAVLGILYYGNKKNAAAGKEEK
ncbi:MAG: chromate transporter, partial [Firmicutes bacterium]|nr:chromate transporter [Bacillota bacterium]